MAQHLGLTRPRRRAAAWTAALAAACLTLGGLGAGGEEGAIWTPAGTLPADLKIRAVALTGADTGVVVGYQPGKPAAGASPREMLEAERAAILYSKDGGETFTPTVEGQGAVIAVDFCDEQHGWAVVARPRPGGEGSLYYLFTTETGGAAWREIAAIPGKSVTQVVRSAVDRGWVLGAGTLMRSKDAGVTWTDAVAPGKRSSTKERIVADGPDGLIIAGPTVLRTADLGESWQTLDLAGGRAQAARGSWLVVAQGASVVFGALEGGTFKPRAKLPDGTRAERIVADGQTVRILADLAGSGDQREVALLVSADGGANFRSETLPVPASAHVGLRGASAAWAVTLDRRVLTTK